MTYFWKRWRHFLGSPVNKSVESKENTSEMQSFFNVETLQQFVSRICSLDMNNRKQFFHPALK